MRKTTPIRLRAATFVLSGLTASGASAGMITVTNPNDDGAGSLRAAVASAAPGDIINFNASLSGQTLTLTSGPLQIAKNLTIDGSSLSTRLAVSGANDRIFVLSGNATVGISALSIINGRTSSNVVTTFTDYGGAIHNSAGCNLTLSNCVLSGNSAEAKVTTIAGGYLVSTFLTGGGAIFNAGTLALHQTTFSNNSAVGTEAYERGQLISGGISASGGAIHSVGDVSAVGCTFTGNLAKGGPAYHGGPGKGGAIHSAGNLTLLSSTFTGNTSEGGKGIGNPEDSNPNDRLADAGGSGDGGALYNAGSGTVTECTFAGNSATAGKLDPNKTVAAAGLGRGGAINNQGPLAIHRCTISGNHANGGVTDLGYTTPSYPIYGAAIQGGGASGGGVYNENSLQLYSCTVTGNTGTGGATGKSPGSALVTGGGNAAGAGLFNRGTMTLNSCTISGNSNTGGTGGTRVNGPEVGPSGSTDGGGIHNAENTVILRNTLVALNTSGIGPDLSGAFSSQAYNFIGNNTASTGIANGVNADWAGSNASPIDPLLAPLGDHGGPTFTMALKSGSPAINSGDDSSAGDPVTDQRGTGFPRRSGPFADIGAFEFGNGASPPTIASLSAGGVSSDPVTKLGMVTVGSTVTPNSFEPACMVFVEYGISTGYGFTSIQIDAGKGYNAIPLNQVLGSLTPGVTWHYRWVAVSPHSTQYSPDQTITVGMLGDVDGNGEVSNQEFNGVLANVPDAQATQNAAGYYSLSQVHALHAGAPLITRNPSTGKFKLTMEVAKSPTLQPGSFVHFPFSSPGTTTNIVNGKLEFEFGSPDNAQFFRVESK